MELESAIAIIRKYRDTIHRDDIWHDPVALSDIMTKLAVGNAYLADHIAPLHKNATETQYAIFVEAKNEVSATQAEAMARGESTKQREMYENVLNIYRATDNLISVLQSRVRVADNQIKREGQ